MLCLRQYGRLIGYIFYYYIGVAGMVISADKVAVDQMCFQCSVLCVN